jgi:hypothetical protein
VSSARRTRRSPMRAIPSSSVNVPTRSSDERAMMCSCRSWFEPDWRGEFGATDHKLTPGQNPVKPCCRRSLRSNRRTKCHETNSKSCSRKTG